MSTNDTGGRRPSEFQSAVERLEKAVQDLAASARDEPTGITGRAASILEETSARLERELEGGEPRAHGSTRRRSRRGRARDRARDRARTTGDLRPGAPSRHLWRDTANAKICGVCAGIANYFGVEPWVIRCGAITGLLFLPGVVFPAYWVMYFVMDDAPDVDKPSHHERKRARSDDRRYSSPAPELGPRLSPRGTLRDVQADLQEAELKLRRIETLVTSGQFELQKELHKLENGGGSARA